MDDITYDEDGNPVTKRPPRGPNKTRRSGSRDFLAGPTSSHSLSSQQEEDQPGYVNKSFNEHDSDNVFSDYCEGPELRSSRTGSLSGKGFDLNRSMTAIFQVDGQSCDVILEDGKITWNHISGSNKALKGMKSKGFMKRIRRNSGKGSRLPSGLVNSISICDILGARIKRLRRDNQVEGEGVCEGVAVHTYEVKGECRYKERTILLGHPSEDLCKAWINRIVKELEVFQERPKRLKVFLQPFAGGKTSRRIYNMQIKPLFAGALCKTDVIEVLHNEHIKHEMIHLEVDDYDSIVCIGGDGTVSKVVNGLLSHTQSENNINIKPNFSPVKASLPVGIIPVGTVNQICHSVMGTEDPETAAIHIILGHRQCVDVCSLFQGDKFERWAFLCNYGFFGSVLPFLTRYQRIGESRLEAAFVKALTKAKFRPYECEIQYLPISNCGNPKEGISCRQSCQQCQAGQHRRGSRYSDTVEELDPLAQSSTSSTITDLSTKVNQWETVQGVFLSASMLSMPGSCSLAPLGMSKYTHLNDGCLDLILVRNTAKKEFVRYLRRHGNHKNQLNFPFIETYRCKEVKFHVRFDSSWKQEDYNFSEIDCEIERQEKSNKFHRSKSMVNVVDDLDSYESGEDVENDFASLRNGSLVSTLNSQSSGSFQDAMKGKNAEGLLQEMDEENGTINSQKNRKNMQRQTSYSSEGKSKIQDSKKDRKNIHILTSDNRDEHVQQRGYKERSLKSSSTSIIDEGNSRTNSRVPSRANSVIDVSMHRSSPVEPEHARRTRATQKRVEKKKTKEEKRMRSIWNIDNSSCSTLDLDFRIHAGLVTFHGLGIPVEFEPDEVRHGCLAVFRT